MKYFFYNFTYFYYNIPSFLLPPSLFFCPLSSNPSHLFFLLPPGVLYYLHPHMKEESTRKQEVLQVVMATYSSLLDACLASDMVRCYHPIKLLSPHQTVLVLCCCSTSHLFVLVTSDVLTCRLIRSAIVLLKLVLQPWR